MGFPADLFMHMNLAEGVLNAMMKSCSGWTRAYVPPSLFSPLQVINLLLFPLHPFHKKNGMISRATMKPTDQHKGFAIKAATLFASLCAFALVVVQNNSLNTQISSLQNELEIHRNSGYDTPRNVPDMRRMTHVRSQVETINEPSGLLEESDMELDLEKEDGLVRRKVRKLSSKKSGSGSSGKSSKKSSKRDCSSSRTNDSASAEESSDESTSMARCEGM